MKYIDWLAESSYWHAHVRKQSQRRRQALVGKNYWMKQKATSQGPPWMKQGEQAALQSTWQTTLRPTETHNEPTTARQMRCLQSAVLYSLKWVSLSVTVIIKRYIALITELWSQLHLCVTKGIPQNGWSYVNWWEDQALIGKADVYSKKGGKKAKQKRKRSYKRSFTWFIMETHYLCILQVGQDPKCGVIMSK